MVRIVLMTADQLSAELFRKTLESCPDAEWRLSIAEPFLPPPMADVYVWDCDPGAGDWERASAIEGEHIFLIDRADVDDVMERQQGKPLVILLKPLHSVTLRPVLERLMARTGSRRGNGDWVAKSLMQTSLRLQEYEQDRTSFLARVVHDFRSPLNALAGYCELLLGSRLGDLDAEQEEALRRMEVSIRRMNRMTSALFQLSIGRWVESEPDLQEADIEACTEQAVQEVAPRAVEKNIRVSLKLQPPERDLRFDTVQMERVLVNLLDNACRFTPRGGSIQVRGYPTFWDRRNPAVEYGPPAVERRRSTAAEVNAYRLDVTDTGPGIPAGQLAAIFEEYTSCADVDGHKGGGLGLPICSLVMGAHKGRVFAQSDARGATFTLLLPYLPPEGPGPRADCHSRKCQ